MTKLLALIGVVLWVNCVSAASAEYQPTFQLDYAQCGENPVINPSNAVTFGTGATCHAGRVVSAKRYRNITNITATIDLSKLRSNYVNAAFYMVENPATPGTQPKGGNYCDAGGNHNEWNCREIDLIETNGNKITQTSMHLGDGGTSASQRYEYTFAAAANNSCFNYSDMVKSPKPSNGLHNLVDNIDMNRPFSVEITFTYGTIPGMKTSFTQSGKTVVVYDTTVGAGAEGSGTLPYQDLTNSMNNGYWLEVSFWQGWSPTGPGSSPWWNNSCHWGALCNSAGSYWGISDVRVTAEDEL